jgi:large subunit ribosomal protein L17
MIKTYNGSKLGITSSHKKALVINLSVALLQHEQIVTTLSKAKELLKYSEKIITRAKKNNLQAIRLVMKKLNNNKQLIKKIFTVLVPRYETRDGGYIKIVKSQTRRGDSAQLVVVSLIK